ncbi:hypothetical protein AMECASPLE_022322 [Ameca splendens]|uniref:Uncharacterized protein n=1 Tax=Ameca splendens TaxID=208324 RepID=A0ABV0Z227_9TELE
MEERKKDEHLHGLRFISSSPSTGLLLHLPGGGSVGAAAGRVVGVGPARAVDSRAVQADDHALRDSS